MSERVEKLIKDYPQMVIERDCLRYQLQNFHGVTEQDVIDSMNFSTPQDDQVQTSNISDKTCSIAATYKERVERLNREWVEHLMTEMVALDEELDFFHAALKALPGVLAEFMHDLVVAGMTWDVLESKYHISRFTVSTYKKKAIRELDLLYAAHDKGIAAYILS